MPRPTIAARGRSGFVVVAMAGTRTTIRRARRTIRSGRGSGLLRRSRPTTVMTVRLRSVGIGMTLAAGLMQSCQPACAPTPPAAVVHTTGRCARLGPSGRGRHGGGLHRRRRPARARRHGVAVRGDGHARTRRLQRRARAVGPSLRRRHHPRRDLRAGHDDGAERRRVPVLREPVATGRSARRVAPGPGQRLLGRDAEHPGLQRVGLPARTRPATTPTSTWRTSRPPTRRRR